MMASKSANNLRAEFVSFLIPLESDRVEMLLCVGRWLYACHCGAANADASLVVRRSLRNEFHLVLRMNLDLHGLLERFIGYAVSDEYELSHSALILLGLKS